MFSGSSEGVHWERMGSDRDVSSDQYFIFHNNRKSSQRKGFQCKDAGQLVKIKHNIITVSS